MNLYQLYYFRTMAKLQHYTKAAEELCMTQPSLSHAISSLEEELGVLLFEKHGRNVHLTKYGELFLPFVEDAIDEIENGTKKIKEVASWENNLISVGYIYTLSLHFIPTIIEKFKKEHPNTDIQFSLKEGSTVAPCTHLLVQDLKKGKLDLIFASLIPNDPDVEFIPICEQELVAILPNDCPLANRGTIDLRDTEHLMLVDYSGKFGLKKEINELFKRVGVEPLIACEVEDELSIARLVEANIGFAVVPYNPMLRDFKIKIRSINNPAYRRPIYIGCMKNRQLDPYIELFKDYVIHSSNIYKSMESVG